MTVVPLAQAWAKQIAFCDAGGSPFTARVLEAVWAAHEHGGALDALLPYWPGNAWADAVPLRVAGALHALALSGADAELAALYPPARNAFDAARGPAAVARALAEHRALVAEYLALAPQTNEIGRSAVLLGGFAVIAREAALPLAMLEIGASAGLNQYWNRYRYELGATRWGDASSPVAIASDWQGSPPQLPLRIDVDSHRACDLSPVDLTAPGAALRLLSYVWPDQQERLARLRAAIALAQTLGVRVEAADALDWTRRELAVARPGRATVLYHSVMWQYLPEPTREALRQVIADAGLRATALHVAGRCARVDLVEHCMAALADADPRCAFEAARSALLLGDRSGSLAALEAVAVDAASPFQLTALRLALKLMPNARARTLLAALAQEPARTRALIQGIAIAGDPHYVPWLIARMQDLKLTRLAGEAFAFITGLDLAYLDLERKPPEGVELGPNDDPNDANVAMDEDDSLPWPDPEKITAWWQVNGVRFASGTRYFMGAVPAPASCREALKTGFQRQRIAAADYLTLLTPGTPLFNTAAPTRRQQRLLGLPAH